MTQRVVRARLKPIEEIPPEFLCCESARQAFSEAIAEGEILEVLPLTFTESAGVCKFCRQEFKNVKVVSRLHPLKGRPSSEINVACYEFDEGLRGGTQDVTG